MVKLDGDRAATQAHQDSQDNHLEINVWKK